MLGVRLLLVVNGLGTRFAHGKGLSSLFLSLSEWKRSPKDLKP